MNGSRVENSRQKNSNRDARSGVVLGLTAYNPDELKGELTIDIMTSSDGAIMKLRSFFVSAVLAAAACLAQGAAAATVERTAPVVKVDDGLGGFNAHLGDTFTAATSSATFTDIFTFSAGAPFDAAAALTSSYLNSAQTRDLSITALSLYRYDPATLAQLGTAIAGIDQTGSGQNPTDAWALSAYDLAGGAYALRVDGIVRGVGGGAFGADLTISAVPEVPAWGMLLAGVGALAALGWRRRRPAALRP